MVMRMPPVQGVPVQSSMIICDARTGSNLLGYSLGSHSHIKYGDEILSESCNCIPNVGKDWAESKVSIIRDAKLSKEKRQILATPEYLDFMFTHFNLFKLLYYHIEPALIDYIENFPGKIIHLKRKSFLDKCISWFVAQRDGGFLYKHRPSRKKPILIDIPKLDYYLNRMIAQQKMWDTILTGVNIKTIYYDEMVGDWNGTMKSCQNFLDIPIEPLREKTRQAIPIPNIELVMNKRDVLDFMKDYEEYL